MPKIISLTAKKKHLCDVGLAFIKKLETVGLGRKSFVVSALELEIIRGNKQIVIEGLGDLENSNELECCQGHISSCKEYWEREEVVRKIFLDYWKRGLNDDLILAGDIITRKKIVHFALIDFLLGGEGFDTILEVYAQAFKRENLLESLKEYGEKKCSSQGKKNYFQEDEVLFLSRERVEENLEGVFRKVHPYDFPLEQVHENSIGIYLDGCDNNFLVKNADNLLVSLMEMNLHESALKFIDKIRDNIRKESVEYQINMAYIEVVLLARAKKYYKAMDLIDDSLDCLPVKAQERDVFLKKRDSLMEQVNSLKGKG